MEPANVQPLYRAEGPRFLRCELNLSRKAAAGRFQHQSKELSPGPSHPPSELGLLARGLEVDARFGAMLFKGQAATQPKPRNEKVQMEAGLRYILYIQYIYSNYMYIYLCTYYTFLYTYIGLILDQEQDRLHALGHF